MNRKLKAKIIEQHGKQWKFAKKIGVDESIVSKVVTGAKELPEQKQSDWAKELDCNVKDIFPA